MTTYTVELTGDEIGYLARALYRASADYRADKRFPLTACRVAKLADKFEQLSNRDAVGYNVAVECVEAIEQAMGLDRFDLNHLYPA